MADPLSLPAGVVGILGFTFSTVENLLKFYKNFKDQREDVAKIIGRLEHTLRLLVQLGKVIEPLQSTSELKELQTGINGLKKGCDDAAKALGKIQGKFDGKPDNYFPTLKGKFYQSIYALKPDTIQKIEQEINKIRDNLWFELDILHHNTQHDIQNDLTSLKSQLRSYQTNEDFDKVKHWLSPPDSEADYREILETREAGTANWLFDTQQFSDWSQQRNSLLWISGFAGTGKSVLCSSAIEHLHQRRQREPRTGVACFYFRFDDETRHDLLALLKAVVWQLSDQLPEGYEDLAKLRTASAPAPTPPALLDHLKALAKRFDQVYLVVDALDESPINDKKRRTVITKLTEIRERSESNICILVSSRDEEDIRGMLESTHVKEIQMKNARLDQDIKSYISAQLATDPELKRWVGYRDQIEGGLADRAHGVFRWVYCQLEDLKRLPRSQKQVNLWLQSLPNGLSSTYERLLGAIQSQAVSEARTILTFLCFARRPMTVNELLDALAVDLDTETIEDANRLEGELDLRIICGSLITITQGWRPTVRLAHFSVQDYLLRGSMPPQLNEKFGLCEPTAQGEITRICLSYLLNVNLDLDEVDSIITIRGHFEYYAATFWHEHYATARGSSQMDETVIKFFTQDEKRFLLWPALHDILGTESLWSPFFRPLISERFEVDIGEASRYAFYYACFLGLPTTLLQRIMDMLDFRSHHMDMRHYNYGTLLQAASARGYAHIVNLLIQNGADVHSEPGTALIEASREGHGTIVEILLNSGKYQELGKEFFRTPSERYVHQTSYPQVVDILNEISLSITAAVSCDQERVFRIFINWVKERLVLEEIQYLLDRPLCLAVENFEERYVRALIHEGAAVTGRILAEAVRAMRLSYGLTGKDIFDLITRNTRGTLNIDTPVRAILESGGGERDLFKAILINHTGNVEVSSDVAKLIVLRVADSGEMIELLIKKTNGAINFSSLGEAVASNPMLDSDVINMLLDRYPDRLDIFRIVMGAAKNENREKGNRILELVKVWIGSQRRGGALLKQGT